MYTDQPLNELDVALDDPAEIIDTLFVLSRVNTRAFNQSVNLVMYRRPEVREVLRECYPTFDWHSAVGIVGRALGLEAHQGPDGLMRSYWK